MIAAAITAAGVILAALIGLVGVLHARKLNELEATNTRQHLQGYGLLQSIDARTINIADTLGEHGERITRLEADRVGVLGEHYRLDIPPADEQGSPGGT